jgi:hypothetical protein
MASLSDAFPAPNNDARIHEQTENPQSYDDFAAAVRHVKERRHILGLVGGNEVSRIAGNQADLESDLFGITRPNTDCATRKHLPQHFSAPSIERKNPKMRLSIDVQPVHLPVYQQWAYPSVIAPEPLKKETCGQPHKY